MVNNINPQLKAFLDASLNIANYKLSLLNSGGTNQHYKVSVPDGSETSTLSPSWFLKVFITNSLQVVDRQQQFHIQQQLAQKGLAPEPVALSSCGNYWLEQWCSPEPIDTSLELTPETISLLADAIARIHQCKISAPELDVKAEWLRYLTVANKELPQYDQKIHELLAVYHDENESVDSFCFCHNDLHLSHILQSNPLRIVDWEYSAVGNRYFDLAACAMVNEFDEKQLEKFIDRYSDAARIPRYTVASGMQRLRPVVDFTNELWHNAYNTIS